MTPTRPGGPRSWAQTWRAAAAGTLVALSVRHAFLVSTRETAAQAPIDRLYAPLARAMPRTETYVEYVQDREEDHAAKANRRMAQFAVAPVILVDREPGSRWILAWSDDPSRLEGLGAERGGRLVARIEGGFALFERSPR
jgi:hypothetical protein